ncbi:MAG: Gldg family protein [Gemmataceae bacterium]
MSSQQTTPSGLTNFIANSRATAGRVLIVIGLVLIGLATWAVWVNYESLTPNWPLIAWAAIPAFGVISLGFWLAFGESADPEETGRLSVLALAALFGGTTFLFGLAFLFIQSEAVVSLLTLGDRTHAWKVLAGLAAVVFGLALMFAGMQAVRSAERRSVTLRRAVYGFNAFLTGFLLLAVLVIVNVLSVLKLPAAIDATRSGRNSLSDATIKLLASVDRPLHVYLIYEDRGFLYEEAQNFLRLCQERSPRVTVDELSIANPGLTARLRELLKKYPQIPGTDPLGMLLVYGEEKPENSSFVRLRDLVSEDMSPRGESNAKFQGEVKFGTELSFLMSGKQKTAVYFTQGHNEPDLNDSAKPNGLGKLKDRLEKRNFEVKPLTFEAVTPKVPDDAKIVVFPNPKRAINEAEADALKAFIERGGKLIALLDVPSDNRTDKTMPPTGLEALLAQYGVEVTATRVISVVGIRGAISEDPDIVLAGVTTVAEDNPITAAFGDMPLVFQSVRVIRALPTPPPGYRATPLIATANTAWVESDLQANVEQITKKIIEDPEERRARLKERSIPFVVAVATSSTTMPGAPPSESKPKLAVFGDINFVSNQTLGNAQAGTVYFDLFASSLEWLRERPSNIGIEPRSYPMFEMNADVGQRAGQLIWMPLLVAVLAIGGLGLGVWIVRRQ